MKDIHTELALELFGDASPENRAKAKVINYARLYSSGEIRVSRVSGFYPTGDIEW
jgi:DNA polymerase I-like protein with 3'-5' exonuclease and polymerase domains